MNNQHLGFDMKKYSYILALSEELISAVDARDALTMQQKIDELEAAYKKCFGNRLDCFEAFHAFMKMQLAAMRYFAHNNMFEYVHSRYKEVAERMVGFLDAERFNKEQKETVNALFSEMETIHKATPECHQNMVNKRFDTRCCLCRKLPANKTGSHMVPNFLAHPTFSWDGKGKRFREALNHDFINAPEKNCQFYGREVPEWRFAKGEGKEQITEDDIKNNINQLEFDNEFCARCENRFGVLESAYSPFYNGQQKKIHPRVAYLFWLSVLWRMSMGSMSIFMDINDELSLRELLDDNMLDTAKDIAESNTDLGEWQYAIFRAEGLKEGDKGILGNRKDSSPYVVAYNDLVMVFFHNEPTDAELSIGPIIVKRDNLNDWHSPEKSVIVDRAWFWDVRDWFVETSYDFYDPMREKALITLREKERSEGRGFSDKMKADAVKIAKIAGGPKSTMFKLHKMERIYGAWERMKKAKEDGKIYDPLKDDELFLRQKDFDLYFKDLARFSRNDEYHDIVAEFPFYAEARRAIADEREWEVSDIDDCPDKEYEQAMGDFISQLSPKELDHLVNGVQEPVVNPYKGIGRNDPCPCKSGLKFKKCCGKNL